MADTDKSFHYMDDTKEGKELQKRALKSQKEFRKFWNYQFHRLTYLRPSAWAETNLDSQFTESHKFDPVLFSRTEESKWVSK